MGVIFERMDLIRCSNVCYERSIYAESLYFTVGAIKGFRSMDIASLNVVLMSVFVSCAFPSRSHPRCVFELDITWASYIIQFKVALV